MRILPRVARKKRTPVYTVGAASRLTGLPVWTLRWIEKRDLVCPCRTDGQHRLFSDEDIDLLNQIRDLMEEGVNAQGIRVILRMRVTITRARREGGRSDGDEIG